MKETVVDDPKQGNFYLGSGIKPSKSGVNLTLFRRDKSGKLHAALLIDAETGEVEIRGAGVKPYLELKNNKLYVNGKDIEVENSNLKSELTNLTSNLKVLGLADENLMGLINHANENRIGHINLVNENLIRQMSSLNTQFSNLTSNLNGSVNTNKAQFNSYDKKVEGLKSQLSSVNTTLTSLSQESNSQLSQIFAVTKMQGPQGKPGPIGVAPKEMDYLRNSVEEFWVFHKKITEKWAAAEKAEAERKRKKAAEDKKKAEDDRRREEMAWEEWRNERRHRGRH